MFDFQWDYVGTSRNAAEITKGTLIIRDKERKGEFNRHNDESFSFSLKEKTSYKGPLYDRPMRIPSRPLEMQHKYSLWIVGGGGRERLRKSAKRHIFFSTRVEQLFFFAEVLEVTFIVCRWQKEKNKLTAVIRKVPKLV